MTTRPVCYQCAQILYPAAWFSGLFAFIGWRDGPSRQIAPYRELVGSHAGGRVGEDRRNHAAYFSPPSRLSRKMNRARHTLSRLVGVLRKMSTFAAQMMTLCYVSERERRRRCRITMTASPSPVSANVAGSGTGAQVPGAPVPASHSVERPQLILKKDAM